MESTKITKIQLQSTIAIFLCGSTIITGGSYEAKQDTWICLIFSFVLMIPIFWVYSALINLNESGNFFDCILKICGRIPGGAICLLYALYTLIIGGMITRLFAEFIRTVNMTETPLSAILVSIVGTIIIMLKNRLCVISRISKFMFPFFLFFVCVTIVLSFQVMNSSNLKPMLYSGLRPITSTVLQQMALPWGELLFCLPMFGALNQKENNFSILFKGSLIGLLVQVAVNLRNLLVLGYSAGTFAFPSYEAVSIIAIGEFFSRIEALIGINLFLTGFMKIAVMGYSSSKALASSFGFQDYEPLTAPCGILIFTLAFLAFQTTEDLFYVVKYLPYIALPLEVLLPIVLLIIGKIKNQIKQSRKNGKEKKAGGAPAPQKAN